MYFTRRRRSAESHEYVGVVFNIRLDVARSWIVVGYAVAAAGVLVNFTWEWSQGMLFSDWRGDIEQVAVVLVFLAALGAWWFLSRVDAERADQRLLLFRAFLFLCAESLLNATVYLLSATSLHFEIPVLQLWTFGLGALISGVGFFVTAMSFHEATRVLESDDAIDPQPTSST